MNTYHLLATIHLLANAMVLGGVFMNVFIVWPAAKATLGRTGFPLDFLVNEGRRIAPWIYAGLGAILVSWIGLLLVHPPVTGADDVRLGVRLLAYAVMLGNSLYATSASGPRFNSPPKTKRGRSGPAICGWGARPSRA